CAISTRPGLATIAPVKAPCSYPNNSLSSSVPGIAAQLTLTNSPEAYSEFTWIHRASASLPVPPSPQSKIGTFVRQIFSALCRSSAITAERPNKTGSGGTWSSLSQLVLRVGHSPAICSGTKALHIANQRTCVPEMIHDPSTND